MPMLRQNAKLKANNYTLLFLVPAAVIYILIFIMPTFMSFFYSLTIWNLTDYKFCGFDNYILLFKEPSLRDSIGHTLIYSGLTTLLKVVIAVPLAVLLTSKIKSKHVLRSVVLFPYIVSTLAVGLVFSTMMHPTHGIFNAVLTAIGFGPVDWLGNPDIALYSIILVDVWKGVGVATIICIAGIQAIPKDYYEAVSIDGGSGKDKFFKVTLPLIRPSITSVIILAFVGGMRYFDLIWSMTKGGPGFATDVLASIVYKQYAAGFYGLATAGNVVMFILIAAISFPLYKFLVSKEADI